MKTISDLPKEKLVEIFERLPPSSLKDAVLVNKWWKNLGDYPALWKWCKATVYSKEDVKNLGWGKLKKIQEIRINPRNRNADDLEAFFLVSMGLLCLKKIDGFGRICGFSKGREGYEVFNTVEKGVFAKALAKLEEVELEKSPYDQIEELFTEMSQQTRIKKIYLSQHDLSLMDSDLFATVLSRVEDILLFVNYTTIEQMTAFLTQILEQKCLKRIHLNEFSVSYLEPTLLARALALAGLEEVRWRRISLNRDGNDDEDRSNDQIAALFTELSQGTRLRKLELVELDLTEVEPTVFAKTLSRIEILGLDDSEVTRDQMQALLTEISLTGQVKKLTFPMILMSHLEPELLAEVLAKMEDVRLEDYSLTPELMMAFFTNASVSTHLKTLYVGRYANLTFLDPNVLAILSSLDQNVLGILSTLDANDLNDPNLDPNLRNVLNDLSSLDPNVLTHVFSLDPNVLTHLPSLVPNIVSQTLNRLEALTLMDQFQSLTDLQYQSLFTQMSVNTQLKKLEISFSNLSSINPQVLATALNGLDEVTFKSVRLTHDQVAGGSILLQNGARYKDQETEFLPVPLVRLRGGPGDPNTKKKQKKKNQDLSALEAETIATALNKLKEAYLSSTRLSLAKMNAILASVLEEGSKLRKFEWRYKLPVLPFSGGLDGLNTEIVAKVQDKLKGELVLSSCSW